MPQPALAYPAWFRVATNVPTASRLVAKGRPVGIGTVWTFITKSTWTVLPVKVVVPHVTVDERFSAQANSLLPRYAMRVFDSPRSVTRTRSVSQSAPTHGCSKRQVRGFEAPTAYVGPRNPVVSLLDRMLAVMAHVSVMTGTFSALGAALAVTAVARLAARSARVMWKGRIRGRSETGRTRESASGSKHTSRTRRRSPGAPSARSAAGCRAQRLPLTYTHTCSFPFAQ